jgi:hypothetical protein
LTLTSLFISCLREKTPLSEGAGRGTRADRSTEARIICHNCGISKAKGGICPPRARGAAVLKAQARRMSRSPRRMCFGYLPPSQPAVKEPRQFVPPIAARASALSIGSCPQIAR